MRDYLSLSCTPTDEQCQQLGPHFDADLARRECQVFRDQLRREFGEEPIGARLAVKSFPHDFGSYPEVVCYYDDDFPESVDYAFRLENELPQYWDSVSRETLGIFENA